MVHAIAIRLLFHFHFPLPPPRNCKSATFFYYGSNGIGVATSSKFLYADDSMIQKFVKLQQRSTRLFPSPSSNTNKNPTRHLSSFSAESVESNRVAVLTPGVNPSSTCVIEDSPLSGLHDDLMVVGYLFGKKKATEVAHSVWSHIVQKGDVLVDATCGNGYDTLAMVKMVADKSRRGRVYSMDVQKVALENASSLLDESLNPDEKGLVELFAICHSKMEEVVPEGVPVRLVAFNLGYLPGSDKAIITRSETTLQALEAAKRMLAPRGLISVVVYVGHPGGMEEFEAVQAFATRLPVENWTCCKLQMLNRPLAPVLILLLKR